MTLSTTSVDSRPFSIRSDSSARTRWTTQGSGSVWWLPMSGLRRVEIALPEIDVHALLRLRGVSPQLPRLEAHAVERLGAASAPVRVRVRQNVNPVESVDAPAVPARVARQARMAGRLPVARDDSVSRLEARPGLGLALLGQALAHHVHHRGEELGVLAVGQGSVRIPLEVPEAVIAAEVVDAVHGGCARMIPRGAGTVKRACVPRRRCGACPR